MPSPLVLQHQHSWDLTPAAARQVQDDLRAYVRSESLPIQDVQSVAGVDVSYQDDRACAAVVVLQFPGLQPLEQATAELPLSFPYIPGLLSFREVPGILTALEHLGALPDVLIVDGHGLAHPRRFGLACHLGVLLDLPAIGCAKSILVGESGVLGNEVGSTSELILDGEVLGIALRTRREVKPVYVSIGHGVDLDSAVQTVLASGRGFRLPEPIRRAHALAKESYRAR